MIIEWYDLPVYLMVCRWNYSRHLMFKSGGYKNFFSLKCLPLSFFTIMRISEDRMLTTSIRLMWVQGQKTALDGGCFPHFASQTSSVCALQMKDAVYAPSTPMKFNYLITFANNQCWKYLPRINNDIMWELYAFSLCYPFTANIEVTWNWNKTFSYYHWKCFNVSHRRIIYQDGWCCYLRKGFRI